LFVNPGLGGYQLLIASPCLNKGKIIFNNTRKDFWSNPVSVSIAPNIGAYNGEGK